MREYKTKPTAIKHVRAGEDFTDKAFRQFWTDKEVCIEVVARRPRLLRFVMAHNPDIEWDSDFVTKAFEMACEIDPKSAYVSEIVEYLPPEITSAKTVALQATEHCFTYFEKHMSPNLLFDKDVFHAYKAKITQEVSEMFREFSLRMGGPKGVMGALLEGSPKTYWWMLENLRESREASANICADLRTFRFAFDGLDDDEEFVLDVLKMAGTNSLRLHNKCSYRIRKAARDMDLMSYLETAVQAKRLEALLKPKGGDDIVARNKTKI